MKHVDDDGADDGLDSPYNSAVGARLRNIRHQRRMTQFDVERLSDSEFKASVLGAYERGERVLSLPRLERLARFYGVPVEDVLPNDDQLVVERRPNDAAAGKIVLNLTKLASTGGEPLNAMKRFVDMIQVQRQDFNGRLLSIRNSDRHMLAAILDLVPEAVVPRLESMDLLYRAA